MKALLQDAAERASRYLDDLPTRAVTPAQEAIDRLRGLNEPLPAHGQPPLEVLRRLDELGSPATAAMAGGRYIGFVIGGALPVATAANSLATAWDRKAALRAPTPGVAAFEHAALRWLLDILGLPHSSEPALILAARLLTTLPVQTGKPARPRASAIASGSCQIIGKKK